MLKETKASTSVCPRTAELIWLEGANRERKGAAEKYCAYTPLQELLNTARVSAPPLQSFTVLQ